MTSIYRIVVLVFICLGASTSFSQTGFLPKKIAPAELREDLLKMKDTLQKAHAGLYRYKSKASMDKLFDSCYHLIKDSMLVTDFYAVTSFLIASIEDGHTNCRLSPEVMNDYVHNARVFPAMVMFIHDRAFILCSKQNDALAECELLSIDNHPMKEIINRLFNYIQSDAGIRSHKNWELPEYFQLLYYTLYGSKETFAITYKAKNNDVRATNLHAATIKEIICAQPFVRPDKYLRLEYRPGGIAVLTLKTFFDGYLDNSKENFKSFLDSAFTDINSKQVKKLIIDVRSNQGGNDVNGQILYAYLSQRPFNYYKGLETVSEKFSDTDHNNLKLQQPNKNFYTGKVFVLINGRSFSGVAEFSSIVKSNNRGVFIGEACGGGYYGNTSGDEVNLILPNSRISVRIPMVKYTMAVSRLPDGENGIKPDFVIYHTITDIAEKKDSQLDYALKLVGSN